MAEDTTKHVMQELLESDEQPQLPAEGDVVTALVINASSNEVHVDIDGIKTGVIRGKEMIDESGTYDSLKVGDTVEATVLEIENERGEMELSFRQAGHQKAWNELERLVADGEVISVPVTDANKGGLMVKIGNIEGFLPVSQLTVEHYPRVEGGDKNRILELLSQFIGHDMKVKVIDVSEADNKLIVSEKAAWEDKQREVIAQYTVGDVIEGVVTGVVDFGAFIEFGENLEGLVHISELAWQRIDDPKEYINVGDQVKAKIISIDKSRISLSTKALQDDPWQHVAEKYTVGQVVTGTVLKVNPFGAFVELDRDIHGLAHISELSDKRIDDPKDVVKPGATYQFKILTIEPNEHRLGLSLKAVDAPEKPAAEAESATESTPDEPAPAEEEKPDESAPAPTA